MRYAADHKARTRARILEAAARQVRERGPEAIAVGEVMAAAGLTHGAFYAHFPSKTVLVAEAVSTMFGAERSARTRLAEALAEEDADMRAALRAFLADYLSPRHRDRPERGCPLPALAAEIARDQGAAHDAFAAGTARLTQRIEQALARIGTHDSTAQARTVMAQIVGTVALARALGRGPESDAMLHDNLEALTERLEL